MYNLIDQDDGSCELCASEIICLSKISSLSDSKKCFWDDNEMLCHYKEIKNDIVLVSIIAVTSAFLSTPFVIIFEFLIKKIFSAKIVNEERMFPIARLINSRRFVQDFIASYRFQRNTIGIDEGIQVSETHEISKVQLSLPKTLSSKASARMRTSLHEDLSDLFTDLRNFRRTLSTTERHRFDGEYL
jgi:hypothetical protein